MAYLEDVIRKEGPFDGVWAFSQVTYLSLVKLRLGWWKAQRI